MAKQQTPKFGLCLDWETSGADFGKDSSINYQGLTFGAIIFNTEDFSEVETMYREIKFNDTKYVWSAEAEAIHGKSREHLEQHGVTQEEAAVDLIELISKYFAGSKVLFLGHNPEFDRRFTNQLVKTVGFEFSVEKEPGDRTQIEVHHVMLDTSAAGFITVGLYKSDLLFEKMGFPARGAHNALDDARMTLQTCAVLKSLVSLALTELVG